MNEFPIYIDIDGTLTDDPEYARGKVIPKRVEKVKKMIEDNVPVVIWSAGGTTYARQFCEMNGLHPLIAVGKPHRCVDDKATIRGGGLLVIPETWLDN
jgi:hydroxymethylpyrimidine pyrophosphatase-like HAD family hydrolase